MLQKTDGRDSRGNTPSERERGGEEGGEGGSSRDILITLICQKKQHMGNLSFHNMKGFILQNKITYRTETKEGNDGSGHNGEPTS